MARRTKVFALAAALLGSTAALAVWSAHEERPAAGTALLVSGFAVLVDPARFVRPALPEDADPAFPALYVLAGAGLLGVAVLRAGFPLGQERSRAP